MSVSNGRVIASEEAAIEAGCCCSWVGRGAIARFDPDCPVLHRHWIRGEDVARNARLLDVVKWLAAQGRLKWIPHSDLYCPADPAPAFADEIKRESDTIADDMRRAINRQIYVGIDPGVPNSGIAIYPTTPEEESMDEKSCTISYDEACCDSYAETPKQLRKRAKRLQKEARAIEKALKAERKAKEAAAAREEQRQADIALVKQTLRIAAKTAAKAEDRIYAAQELHKIVTGY